MLIFPKKKIHPIILPTKLFMSKYNVLKEYSEMNTSMYINTKGNVTLLIRNVGYSKYPNNTYVIHEHMSCSSSYQMITCSILENGSLNLDNINIQDIEIEYNLSINPSYWKGLEDIRFLDENNILVVVPELNKNGMPCIFKAKINHNRIYDFETCYPHFKEKNWMPFKDICGEYKVIYKIWPFQIKSIMEEYFELINLPDFLSILDGYNGSTNGLLTEKGYLFLIHKNGEKVHHRWLLFDLTTRNVTITDPFLFFTNSYIEFPCSLCTYNNIVYVSLGLNDNKAFVIELSFDDIWNYFHSSYFY